jgi:hypothetical protein
MVFITFFIGQYWFIFSSTVHEYSFNEPELAIGGHEEDHEGYIYETFVYYEGNWNIRDETLYRRVLISTYYAFTTLSTIGLGDFYPVSNTERLVSSFLMLGGVATFSFIMGELCIMIIKV